MSGVNVCFVLMCTRDNQTITKLNTDERRHWVSSGRLQNVVEKLTWKSVFLCSSKLMRPVFFALGMSMKRIHFHNRASTVELYDRIVTQD